MTKEKMKYSHNILSRIAFVAIILTPSFANAEVTFGATTLKAYVENIYRWSIGMGATLSVLMLVYAGYLLMTSAGNSQQTGQAKEVIVGTLSGLALLAGAALILNLLIA